jgi:hypothetical protein
MNNALLGPCINWENIVFRPCRPCSMSQRKIPAVGMVTAISAAVLAGVIQQLRQKYLSNRDR